MSEDFLGDGVQRRTKGRDSRCLILADESAAATREEAAQTLNYLVRDLWPQDEQPMLNAHILAEDSFAVAAQAIRLIEHYEWIAEQYKLCYLELLAISSTEWAATFSRSTWNDDIWFDRQRIIHHPHTARATTPLLAILQAAATLVPIFKDETKILE